jgi:glycosyltransferase involved in cell wall biosynthesis
LCRILRDKGVYEFVQAAKWLRLKWPTVRFTLVGAPDPDNPSSIPESVLRSWVQDGSIEWWGYQENMPAVLRDASIVVLPSYREGFPKVLMEAAAAGRPIVTTDVAGCRDAIEHGKTGLLVPPRDGKRLALAIDGLLCNSDLRLTMGIAGRALAERAFSSTTIARQQVRLYQLLLTQQSSI